MSDYTPNLTKRELIEAYSLVNKEQLIEILALSRMEIVSLRLEIEKLTNK